MATKTISITEEAYEILKSKKDKNESFSETIVKLSGIKKLSSFYGALDKDCVDALEKNIKNARKRHLKDHLRRIAK